MRTTTTRTEQGGIAGFVFGRSAPLVDDPGTRYADRMQCKHCTTQTDRDWQYCPHCGASAPGARISRWLIAAICLLVLGGLFWIVRGYLQEESSALIIETLPARERDKLEGNVAVKTILDHGWFEGSIYNGSDWTIKEIVFNLTIKEKDGSVRWSRRLKTHFDIAPLATESYSIDVTGTKGLGDITSYVVEARGYRP